MREFFSQRTQLIFLFIYFSFNLLLFINAVPVLHDVHDTTPIHPTYSGAADGQRYWGVAKNLVERKTFEYEYQPGDFRPLRRGGPLSPIIFAAAIYIVGFENAPILIVIIQCMMLYGIGLMARKLADPFQVRKPIVQALIIFNPSLIGLAHHAQSELIFTFLMVLILCVIQFIVGKHKLSGLGFIWFGLLGGLLLLTRPSALVFVSLLPLIFLVVFFLSQSLSSKPSQSWGKSIARLSFAAVIGLITVTPWAIHNHLTLGSSSIAKGKAIFLKANLLSLDRSLQHSETLFNQTNLSYLLQDFHEIGLDPCCIVAFNNDYRLLQKRDASQLSNQFQCNKSNTDKLSFVQPNKAERLDVNLTCNNGIYPKWEQEAPYLFNIYVSLIRNANTTSQIRALVDAWLSTYLAGGASALTNYLGIPSPSRSLIYRSFEGFKSYAQFVSLALQKHLPYFLFFSIATTFAIIARVAGLIGFCASITRRNVLPYNVLYICTLGVFTATYLFIGTSRFRAPLEPILAIYAAVGIEQTYQFFRKLCFSKN